MKHLLPKLTKHNIGLGPPPKKKIIYIFATDSCKYNWPQKEYIMLSFILKLSFGHSLMNKALRMKQSGIKKALAHNE